MDTRLFCTGGRTVDVRGMALLMRFSRAHRKTAALTAAALLPLLATAPLAHAAPAPRPAADPPRTGFERTDGARWTTQPEEQDFLAAVDKGSRRVSLDTIGKTKQGRPVQLVRIGGPTSRAASTAQPHETVMPAPPCP
ncbi:hypothetical protein GCM10009863_23890 [Streptomyces axinellae]|uniref:Uncharacterized protein n=1 Tax=Streptomyces axinellae TaxID=552788 RepID=A0ABN3Q1H6_9ACTN